MAQERIVCRLCKFAQKTRPDRKKINPGRVWCICYRREFNNNRSCPKAERATETKGMMRRKTKKPINKNAFVSTRS